ncbi:MAG: hypothetical protein ABEH40_04860 [Haloferacaceae archaeon]
MSDDRDALAAVHAALAELIEEHGARNASLVRIDAGGVPDVYLVERGVRVVLSAEPAGRRGALIDRMADRIDRGACEVAVGLVVPSGIAGSGSDPTVEPGGCDGARGRERDRDAPPTPAAKRRLADARPAVLVRPASAAAPTRIGRLDVAALPGVIRDHAGGALDAGDLADAVDRVSDAIAGFVEHLARRPDAASAVASAVGDTDGGATAPGGDADGGDGRVREALTGAALALFEAASVYGARGGPGPPEGIRRLRRSEGSRLAAMTAAFEGVRGSAGGAVFGPALDVLAALPRDAETEAVLAGIGDAARYVAARPGLAAQDLSGRVYHAALGDTRATDYATYYTRLSASDLLAWLAVEEWDDAVADFACGSGALPNSAYGRKLALAPPDALAADDRHAGSLDDVRRRFAEEDLTALDAMDRAARLTAANLAARHPRGRGGIGGVYHVPVSTPESGSPRLGSLDLLDPDADAIRVRRRVGDGEGTGGNDRATAAAGPERVRVAADQDVVVMNPPFTRKDRAAAVLDMGTVNEYVRAHDGRLTGQTGLAAPFVLLGHLHLDTGGRLALVLPTAAVNRSSWEPVRELLAEQYHVEHVIVSWAPGSPAWSENTDLREILLVARKVRDGTGGDAAVRTGTDGGDGDGTAERGRGGGTGEPTGAPGGAPTVVTHLDEDVTFRQARAVATTLRRTDDRPASLRDPTPVDLPDGTTAGASTAVPAGLLAEHTDNWYRYAAYRNPDLVRLMLSLEGVLSPEDPPYGVALGDATSPLGEFAEVNLFLKNIRPAGYRVTDDHPGVPADWTANTSTLDAMRLDEDDVQWVHEAPDLEVTEPFTYETGRLLVTEGGDFYHSMRVAATVPERPATGSVWFPVEFPALETTDGERVTPREAGKVVAAWLNSSIGLVPLFGYRAEVRGARGKFRTRQLRRVSVLDPSKLPRDAVDGMIDAYDAVADVEWDLLRHQLAGALDDGDHPRRRLDERVCGALTDGAPDVERIEADLLADIERLGAVMNG